MNSSANHLGNPLVTAGITRIGKNRQYDSPLNSSANNCRRRSLHSRYYSDLTTTTMTKTMTTTTNDVCLKRSNNIDNSNSNDNNSNNNNNNNNTTSPMHGRASSWSMLPPYVPSGNSSISMPVISADLSIPRNSFHRLGLPSQYPDKLDQSSSNSSFESVLLEELEDFDAIFGRPSSES